MQLAIFSVHMLLTIELVLSQWITPLPQTLTYRLLGQRRISHQKPSLLLLTCHHTLVPCHKAHKIRETLLHFTKQKSPNSLLSLLPHKVARKLLVKCTNKTNELPLPSRFSTLHPLYYCLTCLEFAECLL